jgi:hypothetical protein
MGGDKARACRGKTSTEQDGVGEGDRMANHACGGEALPRVPSVILLLHEVQSHAEMKHIPAQRVQLFHCRITKAHEARNHHPSPMTKVRPHIRRARIGQRGRAASRGGQGLPRTAASTTRWSRWSHIQIFVAANKCD